MKINKRIYILIVLLSISTFILISCGRMEGPKETAKGTPKQISKESPKTIEIRKAQATLLNKKYSRMDDLVAFGFLVNAMDNHRSADGDTRATFPRSDAEDMSRGAHFIPGEVTMARRAGERVRFVSECGPCCWYWEMPDGSRIYHWDRFTYQQIGTVNGRKEVEESFGSHFEGGAGPCPHCGNPNTNGGTVKS